jgi:glycosyltransferase involved in cell wall biosynthesis
MYEAWLVKMSLRERRRWREKAVDSVPGIRVYYGQDHVPLFDESASGGIIKCQDLQNTFPNDPLRPNLLYLVSSAMPPHLPVLIMAAKRAGVSIVLNQNGVAYPAWHGEGWEDANKPLALAHSAADYIFYQSKFCQESAWRFLGRATVPYEVLYNPVDTTFFSPVLVKKEICGPVMIVAGSHLYKYRVTTAVDTLRNVCKDLQATKLIIAGRSVKNLPRQKSVNM